VGARYLPCGLVCPLSRHRCPVGPSLCAMRPMSHAAPCGPMRHATAPHPMPHAPPHWQSGTGALWVHPHAPCAPHCPHAAPAPCGPITRPHTPCGRPPLPIRYWYWYLQMAVITLAIPPITGPPCSNPMRPHAPPCGQINAPRNKPPPPPPFQLLVNFPVPVP
jgi:hypothetical protein